MVKTLPAYSGDTSSILGQEDPLEKEMATHYSILAWRILDRGAWQATVRGVSKKLDTTERLNNNCHGARPPVEAGFAGCPRGYQGAHGARPPSGGGVCRMPRRVSGSPWSTPPSGGGVRGMPQRISRSPDLVLPL